MLSAMLNPAGMSSGAEAPVADSTWWLIGLVIFSGLAALIALTRTGIKTFWMPMADNPAPVRVLEIAPVIMLIALTVAMTVMAGPIMNYMTATAAELHAPTGYITDVLATPLTVPTEEVAR